MKDKIKILEEFLTKAKEEKAVGGITAFIWTFIILILFIIFYNNKGVFSNFVTLNDFITSIIIVISLFIAFIIYLTNRNLIPANKVIDKIENMSEDIPFKHSIEKHLIPLIKKRYKIIVLLNDINQENYQSIISQLIAYQDYINEHKIEEEVSFYFVSKDEKNKESIKSFFDSFHINYKSYIIIATVSSIFTKAIEAREELSQYHKDNIKIIGTLTSTTQEIGNIVDKDNNIIRVFPPDYDEARSAMHFLLSKLHNRVCSNRNCTFMLEKTNVIILYNRTYGKAIAKQSKIFFEEELENYKITIPKSIKENYMPEINFIVAKFNAHNNYFEIDKKDTNLHLKNGLKLEDIIKYMQGAKNYFYIVGYEPNISKMLQKLDTIIDSKCLHNILICGTATMSFWRDSIIKTINSSKNLKGEYFYLELESTKVNNKIQDINSIKLSIKPKLDNKSEKIDISEYFKSNIKLNKEEIEKLLKNRQNYISTYTKITLDIAKYAIDEKNKKKNLLECKKSVLENYYSNRDKNLNIELLVNGDSINKYKPKELN